MAQQQIANNEALESSIKLLKEDKIVGRKLMIPLKKIIKALNFYTMQEHENQLPPESLIPVCLFIVPNKLKECIISEPTCEQIIKYISEQQIVLTEQPQNLGLNLLIKLYLKALWKLLQNATQQIKHVIIEGMSRNAFLLPAYPIIGKKWMKEIVKLWAGQSTNNNINLALRCHLFFQKYVQHTQALEQQGQALNKKAQSNYTWLIRRLYVNFFSIARQISWRNYELTNFLINSFCQLVKVNQSKAYYILFGYFRSICLQLDKYNKVKQKQKKELLNKLYSYQMLSVFRLFAAIVSRIQSEQFSALIFPLIEMFNSYLKLSESAQFLPLKLHIVELLISISENTRVYIPSIIDQLLNIFENKIFTIKLHKTGQKSQPYLELLNRFSKQELANTEMVNKLFFQTISLSYRFMRCLSREVFASQFMKKFTISLKKANDNYKYSQYKQQMSNLRKNITKDSQMLSELRSSMSMKIQNEKSVNIYEKKVQKKYQEKLNVIKMAQKAIQDRQQLLRTRLLAENEQENGEDQDEEKSGLNQPVQDEDQVNSGWQEASEGASQFAQQKDNYLKDQQNDQQEISYEGDPDSQQAQQAIMEWSEHQWSSQNQIN